MMMMRRRRRNWFCGMVDRFPIHLLSNHWKHQKTVRLKKGALRTNGLTGKNAAATKNDSKEHLVSRLKFWQSLKINWN